MKSYSKARGTKGILLITTLLILGLLIVMAIGFVEANRANLILASNNADQQKALQAAYSGLQYVKMRFEQYQNYGTGQSKDPLLNANPSTIINTNNLVVYEGNEDIVGIFNNGDSHFQIHFTCSQCNKANLQQGYDDSQITSNTLPSSTVTFNSKEYSVNNLGNNSSYTDTNSNREIPPNSSTIIVIGYAHGVTRVVQALLREKAYIDSAAMAGGSISVGSGTCSSSFQWNIESSDPLYNNIRAGISWNGAKFVNSGGTINCDSCPVNSKNQPTSIFFSNLAQGALDSGSAYALQNNSQNGSIGGTITFGSISFPNKETTQVSTADNSGTFYANSNNLGNPPSNVLQGQDMVNNITNIETATYQNKNCQHCNTPQTFTLPAGIWAFDGTGNTINVFDSNGNIIATYKNNVQVNNVKVAQIKNFQLQILPGMNLVLNGNVMFTLADPPNSTNCNGQPCFTANACNGTPCNIDSKGQAVLPTIGLAYTNVNQVQQEPATLEVNGNLYIQGQLNGNGGIIVNKNPNTTAPSSWFPSSAWGTNTPWAQWVISNSNQSAPSAGDTGDIALEGNSLLSQAPNISLSIYSDGNAMFNPIPNFSNTINSLDGQAYGNALDNLAKGACSNTTGPACNPPKDGGWDNPLSTTGNDNLDPLNNIQGYDMDDMANLLQTASYNGNQTGSSYTQTQSYLHAPGLEGASTGITASQLFGTTTTVDLTVGYFLSNACGSCVTLNSYGTYTINSSNTNYLNLYDYTALRMYLSTCQNGTCDDSVLPISATPPSTTCALLQNCGQSSSLDPVENQIISNLQQFSGQAQANNEKFGQFMYSYVSSNNGGVQYTAQDMYFPGLVYVRGSNGFSVNPDCHSVITDGALVTTAPGANITVQNAQNVTFEYNPQVLYNYIPSQGGYKTTLIWITVW
jgi:ribosomal protein L37AE/L43A